MSKHQSSKINAAEECEKMWIIGVLAKHGRDLVKRLLLLVPSAPNPINDKFIATILYILLVFVRLIVLPFKSKYAQQTWKSSVPL